MTADNPHKGHRERMRKKLEKLGADAMEPHELCEMLLYGIHRQGNTNPEAHRLFVHFGSEDALLNATEEQLSSVGVGAKTMAFLLAAGDLHRYLTAYDAQPSEPETPEETVGSDDGFLIELYDLKMRTVRLFRTPNLDTNHADVIQNIAGELLNLSLAESAAYAVIRPEKEHALTSNERRHLFALQRLLAMLDIETDRLPDRKPKETP